MNRRFGTRGRFFWRMWSRLGLLTIVSFIVHDAGMTSLAPGVSTLLAPGLFSASEARVVHDIRGSEDVHPARDHSSHHDREADADPMAASCDMYRVAVTTATELLDDTMQTQTRVMDPSVTQRKSPGPWPVAGATFPSSRDQRTMCQVFLI
ncbi:MAG: hypothetical protein H0V24_02380 [Chloroflexia bacterium]|nr:hypothetical protein [Chloroflexia bacterium]MDQ3412053.1 hypothetical protein [Chloroflexota bacterium]